MNLGDHLKVGSLAFFPGSCFAGRGYGVSSRPDEKTGCLVSTYMIRFLMATPGDLDAMSRIIQMMTSFV